MDIRDIVQTSKYHIFKKSETLKEYIGVLNEKEAKKVVGVTINGITDILYYSPPQEDVANYRLQLISIKNTLEDVPDRKIQRKSMVDGGCNKIFAFLRQDEEEVGRVTEWEKPISPEKLVIASELSRVTCNYCLDMIRRDIDVYQQNRPLATFTKDQKDRASTKVSKPSRRTPMEAILEGRSNSDDKTALISLNSEDSLIPPSKSPSPDNVTDTLQSEKADSVEKL